MTESRWQKLKVGTVLEHEGSGCVYVVAKKDEVLVSPDGFPRKGKGSRKKVPRYTLVRVIEAHDRRQWKVVTKERRERL